MPERHFIQQIIDADIASGRWGEPGDRSVVRTRFPPEPNGFMHVGHALTVCLNYGLAREFGGAFNLRFDDTNPIKEEDEFVRSIVADVRWLGVRWPGWSADDPLAGVLFASDYFEAMHGWACELIRKGRAYVDERSADEVRATRGTLTEPGVNSPHRDRPPGENLDLFERMTKGEFPDGSKVLRAKIDMKSPNLNLRDPVMYRVLHAAHHRAGSRWCVYPMYDWAHGLEDAIEGITHSVCTLEFENHRPLYDWFLDAINEGRGPGSEWGEKIAHPQQIEYARYNFTSVITSKRRLRQLVEDGHVAGWDDPRMPTVAGLRRRGVTPEAVWTLSAEVGATKHNSVHDLVLLENAVREDLNKRAPRRMAVLDPLKVTITNWGEDGDESRTEWLEAVNNPEDESGGTREVPFTRELYIERADFMEDAPKKFFRLKPGGEVRLRYAYWITCNEVVKDDAGNVVELRCTYDPATRGGDSPPPDAEGTVRKVRGTLHWVSAEHAVGCEVRLFDRLFSADRPGKTTGEMLDDLNPESLVVRRAFVEPSLGERGDDEPAWPDGVRRFQFERLGYFCEDTDSAPGAPVFNRTVTLKDSWAKAKGKG